MANDTSKTGDTRAISNSSNTRELTENILIHFPNFPRERGGGGDLK